MKKGNKFWLLFRIYENTFDIYWYGRPAWRSYGSTQIWFKTHLVLNLMTSWSPNKWLTHWARFHFSLVLAPQIAKTLRLILIRYRSDTFVSDWYLINVDLRVFPIRDGQFSPRSHKRHPIAHPYNWDMRCLFITCLFYLHLLLSFLL